MAQFGRAVAAFGIGCCMALTQGRVSAAAEYNPLRIEPVAIGPEANRLIVGFRTTPGNAVTHTVTSRLKAASFSITQALTSAVDVAGLAERLGLAMAKSRQLTPSMHVLYLQRTLYGADVEAALGQLRRDPAVKFADVDQRRYPLALPDDPLFAPTAGASGQWYMDTPNPSVVVEGVQTMDLAATDAVSAWGITTGSTGIVIADVDTGVRFDHPDLLRAGLGGRLLPGYDFVGEDYDPNTGAPLGTYLEANDGDGWDPDPSDPGDWISSTDQQNSVFPAADCPVANSSWHGTRVVGIFGALTNNDLGIAAMSWGPWVLPVRALGKCGGYDSDIIAAIEWAAGLPVSGTVPANPYPADIINLSLGGSSTCPSDYQDALATVTNMGVLIVASAGNSTTAVTGTSSVEAPANCSATVSGMIAVAGLRNTGTKVGYSSLGPEVGVAAPAGNCINTSGDCLRSIDTTTNLGTTTPGANSYTNETNVNLGTSFSAPISLVRSSMPGARSTSPIGPSRRTSPPCCGGTCGTSSASARSRSRTCLRWLPRISWPRSPTSGSRASTRSSTSPRRCGRRPGSRTMSPGRPGPGRSSGSRTAVTSRRSTRSATPPSTSREPAAPACPRSGVPWRAHLWAGRSWMR